ncbi:aldehyde dehydrogenase family protein [Streptomyces phaeochromogenes]|uniref:Aldehyde dehydrogenase family protein n=1 Tax=Streptomyces phaeochromogenes TaxID=1923 RepID=A0ABZ1HVD4_STRPH|nr:aldehyde dehydrogenase family protein [Streptomyces phaeochromogenes]WSD21278.1 aldehyde dehydrogenase family protein [Streptomyces phaeochromogenes]
MTTVRDTGTDGSRLLRLAADLAAAEHIDTCRAELLEVLTRYESFETATDEIDRSLDTLRNLHREVPGLRTARAGRTAVFLPVNLPLYSLVLFAAVPSLAADSVTVRGPAATAEWHAQVLAVSGLGRYFPRLELVHTTRRTFIQDRVRDAATVIFTGRYENAEEVRRECPGALFLFEGSGPNPVVVGPRADLDASFERIVTARLFNGGQDCAGPDAYLVHTTRAEELLARLLATLAALPTGSYRDPLVRVGPVLNRGPLRDLAQRLDEVAHDVVIGGCIDMGTATVQPTVIVRPLSRHDRLVEFFAPVFYVLCYGGPAELEAFFARDEYTSRAMYASFFGEDVPALLYANSTVLTGRTVLDVERGNDPYRGYGPRANYVARGGPARRATTHAARPIPEAAHQGWR